MNAFVGNNPYGFYFININDLSHRRVSVPSKIIEESSKFTNHDFGIFALFLVVTCDRKVRSEKCLYHSTQLIELNNLI